MPPGKGLRQWESKRESVSVYTADGMSDFFQALSNHEPDDAGTMGYRGVLLRTRTCSVHRIDGWRPRTESPHQLDDADDHGGQESGENQNRGRTRQERFPDADVQVGVSVANADAGEGDIDLYSQPSRFSTRQSEKGNLCLRYRVRQFFGSGRGS
jgi:hypothetical protein